MKAGVEFRCLHCGLICAGARAFARHLAADCTAALEPLSGAPLPLKATATATMKTPLHKRPVTLRPLADLTIHPAIADDARLGAKDARYLAMQAAWEEQGGCPPIYATPGGQIVDGRHRYWWLEKSGEDQAPCIEVTEDEVPLVILGALTGRNHTTKGQLAYLAAPKLEHAFAAAQERRIAVLQAGGKTGRLPVLPTAEELAERLGIGRNLLFQARKIHAFFGEPKKGKAWRKEWEPQILDGEEPVGLGFVVAGLAGSAATKGQLRKPDRNSALNNWDAALRNLAKPAGHWARWDDEQRDFAAEALRKSLVKMPAEVLDVIAAAARAAKKAQTETPAAE